MSEVSIPNPLSEDIKSFSRLGPTMCSLGHVLCTAILLPLALSIVAWQMAPAYDLATFNGSVRYALLRVLPLLFFSLALMIAFRRNGLAQNHFLWPRVFCEGARKGMFCIVWLVMPLRFSYEALNTFENGVWHDSLGRMFFLGELLSLSVALFFICRGINRWRDERLERQGLRRNARQRRQHRQNLFNGGPVDVSMMGLESTLVPLRQVGLLVLASLPMAPAALSVAGYHFTAVELTERGIWTALFAGLIAAVAGLVGRMLLVTQFRVKLRQLKRTESGHINEDETINIEAISSQVNRLIRVTAAVGVVIVGWHLWSEVSPTIRFLDSVVLWETKLPNGEISNTTLTKLFSALGILGITFALSRNLPGLLELTLIDRLPLDRGGRYAISFVVRYVVGLLGLLLAFHVAGFSWNSVKWMAAALSLGLGFGLQEVFANLVSGLIILIERPVRVGDFITVNGISGNVTHMQLRATRIRDLDMREHIVPNKKFITEDVMNWTLSDQISRLILNVGVAYESDTHLVQQTLLAVARQHPLVQSNPGPDVVFESFGDSTLDFQLRVIVKGRELFPKVRHELNMAIAAAFTKQNIEIAFPQREIRLRPEGLATAISKKAA